MMMGDSYAAGALLLGVIFWIVTIAVTVFLLVSVYRIVKTLKSIEQTLKEIQQNNDKNVF